MASRPKTSTTVSATQARSVTDVGKLARDARKRADLDQETAAALSGVGPRFLGELERGKPSVQLGLVLQVLERLGLDVWIAPRGWRPEQPK
jgi:transcriptional regulator with XRE-family HTH domain